MAFGVFDRFKIGIGPGCGPDVDSEQTDRPRLIQIEC